MGITNLHAEYASNHAEIAALKAKIAEFELKQDQLKPFIIEQMNESGVSKMETDIGKFTVSKRKTWTYPEAIVELGDELKNQKAKAESTGEATYEEVEGLTFTPVKL